ncbi:EamA family transporter RarD [Mycolicibacterium litorale]|uniref:EamA family transporter RarD n=1 Tax=Mycolicibacterium litorale TaxID=758802 RepID=UPI003CE70568
MSDARRAGLLFGTGAYVWWGLCPGFFLLLLPSGSLEILAHRIVWSAVFLLLILTVARRLGDLRRLAWRTWLQLLAASALVSANWGVYIYAATHGHVVDAALGYFINPLISVALGVLVFRERISRWQGAALVLAVGAVVLLTVSVGAPPYIAFALAVTFAFYGLVKKVVAADPRVGVAVETLLALPIAGGYLLTLELTGQGHFLTEGAGHAGLLLLAGPVTAIPLLLFAAAAQRLPMVTLGLLFYINPALQMAWGVLIGHEPMPVARWLGFGLIWLALALQAADALRRRGPRDGGADGGETGSAVRVAEPSPAREANSG